MPVFKYSLQARLGPGEAGNIGVMVWSGDTLDYFAVRGEEPHAQDMNGRIAECRKLGREQQEFVDYFLERHGGYFLSMARPEEVEADSPQDAARRIAERWDLDIVVPAPAGSGVDQDVVRQLMAATGTGADLSIHGGSYRATDRAFVLGFGGLGTTVVFGYLPFPYSFSRFSHGRFYVDSVEPVEGGWRLRGRDARKMELGDMTVEVRPVSDLALLAAIARFKDGLSAEEHELIADRLHVLTDPMVV